MCCPSSVGGSREESCIPVCGRGGPWLSISLSPDPLSCPPLPLPPSPSHFLLPLLLHLYSPLLFSLKTSFGPSMSPLYYKLTGYVGSLLIVPILIQVLMFHESLQCSSETPLIHCMRPEGRNLILSQLWIKSPKWEAE